MHENELINGGLPASARAAATKMPSDESAATAITAGKNRSEC
jgi:hypothetical protein